MPPRNLHALMLPSGNMELTWGGVAIAPGFNPPIGMGSYQIGIGRDTGGEYGAAGVRSTRHSIPGNGFSGAAPGSPDGIDFGQSLNELPDGDYYIYCGSSQLDPRATWRWHRVQCLRS